ncbi:MAG: DUF368 domain-containing protein [Bacteroidales bacterium]|nr:DUF368 domain-containing protein [Bacteroidales bacterium]
MRFWKGLIVFIKGILVGAVNVVPISGGAISLILGIYERFINAIRALTPKNFKYLFRGEVHEFSRRTDIRFFFTLVVGIVAGMVLTSVFLKKVLHTQEVYTYAFFFGLIVVSAFDVMRGIGKINLKNIIILLIGLGGSLSISLLSNPEGNNSFMYLFFCGMVGALGMVVPGVSGSHLMMLMGKYEQIIGAVSDLTRLSTFKSGFMVLLPFLLGCLVTIVSFSYLLSWLMRQYRNETLSALSGFMLGSLPVIYPWVDEKTNNPVLPPMDTSFLVAILIAVLGGLTVYLIGWLARREERKIARRKERQERRERRKHANLS